MPPNSSHPDNIDTENAPLENPTFFDHLLALLRLFYTPKDALDVLFSDSWPGLLFTLLLLFGTLPLAVGMLFPLVPPPAAPFFYLQRFIEITPEGFASAYLWLSSFAILGTVLVIGTLQKLLLRIPGESISFADSVASLAYSLFPAFVLQMLTVCLQTIVALTPTDGMSTQFGPFVFGLSKFFALLIWLALPYGAYLWFRSISLLTELAKSQKLMLAALLSIISTIPLIGTALAISYRQFGAPVAPRSIDFISDSLRLKQNGD